MKIFIGKEGDPYYHKEECPIIQNPKAQYQQVDAYLRVKTYHPDLPNLSTVSLEGKIFNMCPKCWKSRKMSKVE